MTFAYFYVNSNYSNSKFCRIFSRMFWWNSWAISISVKWRTEMQGIDWHFENLYWHCKGNCCTLNHPKASIALLRPLENSNDLFKHFQDLTFTSKSHSFYSPHNTLKAFLALTRLLLVLTTSGLQSYWLHWHFHGLFYTLTVSAGILRSSASAFMALKKFSLRPCL